MNIRSYKKYVAFTKLFKNHLFVFLMTVFKLHPMDMAALVSVTFEYDISNINTKGDIEVLHRGNGKLSSLCVWPIIID